MVVRHQLMNGSKGIRLLLELYFSFAEVSDLADHLLALADELLLGLVLQLLADVVPEGLQKLNLLHVLIVPCVDFLLLLRVLLVEAFEEGEEVLLDEALLVAVVQLEAVHLLLDGCGVLAEELDLPVQFGQLAQDAALVLLVHLAEVDDAVVAVLS